MLVRANTLALVAAFAAATNAHTLFTTLFVNGVNQGDGTCVRQPSDADTCTSPVNDLASDDMVCGFNGKAPVNYTCPVPAGATISVEFRLHPGSTEAGSIAASHKGPCAVYMKQVTDSQTSDIAGGGWFKLWDEGYDESTEKWCTEKLIENNGLLSIKLPSGLPGGAYLVRPELLALHSAYYDNNPQYYIGCTQVFVEASDGDYSKTLEIPSKYEAQIPGYVKLGDDPVHFNIYEPVFPYPLAGPPAYYPVADSSSSKRDIIDAFSQPFKRAATVSSSLIAAAKEFGATFVPSNCLVKNANWCGIEVPAYDSVKTCWESSSNCYSQEKACWDSAPPSGGANCQVWADRCEKLMAECDAQSTKGPAAVTLSESSFSAGTIPAAVDIKTSEPASYGAGSVTYSASADDSTSTSAAASYIAAGSSGSSATSSAAAYPTTYSSGASGVAYSTGALSSSAPAATSSTTPASKSSAYTSPAATGSSAAVSSVPLYTSVPLSTGTGTTTSSGPHGSAAPPYANGTWTGRFQTSVTTVTLKYKGTTTLPLSETTVYPDGSSVDATQHYYVPTTTASDGGDSGPTTYLTVTTKATSTVYTTIATGTVSVAPSGNGTYTAPHYRRHLHHHRRHL